MNQTLEEIARALFRSWFVDFDPVRAKAEGRLPAGMDAATAALFPPSLAHLEGRSVPADWQLGTVADLVHIARNSINPAATPDEIFDHYSIPAFDNDQKALREPGSNIKSNKTLVERTAVLISKLNPRIPRVWLPDIASNHRSICSTEFLVVIPKNPSARPFVYALLTSESFTHEFASLVTGTTGSHQRVSTASLLAISTVIPPASVIARFSDIMEPLFKYIAATQKASTSLAAIRDTLLPKLLSGEVRVPEAETILGHVL